MLKRGACAVLSLGLFGCGGTGSMVREEAAAFLDGYQAELEARHVAFTTASWEASTTGTPEAFEAQARASLALRKLHADPERLGRARALLAAREELDPVTARALEVAELAFREQQLAPADLERLSAAEAAIEEAFNTYRAEFEGMRRSDNELLGVLAAENDGARRKAAWEALKQVGRAVGPRLVELARMRNEAAKRLGAGSFWELKVRLQEHDPGKLLALFEELERLTDEPYRRMKASLDAELAARFGIAAEELRPWHYDNPFFQAAPPSGIDLDLFFREKPREEIAAIAARFFAAIGLPVESILARSDLYEREGKSQHAFCEDIDRKGDIRIVCNLRPTAEWMDTMLHELGHAVYDAGIDPGLPFNLRQAAHSLTTEAVAMLLGALAKQPAWLAAWAGAQPEGMQAAIRESRRREQLIFCRWTLVMLHFEKALYENPAQDLNRLWWDLVERFQHLVRPAGRDEPDWAAKPHFTIAPVYYHNYMLGELFAAQLRSALARTVEERAWSPAHGRFLDERVFRPGKRLKWADLVREATGEELGARHFAAEVRQ